MITKEQAQTQKYFTHTMLKNLDGTPLRVRANGKCQTWKTRPEEFKLPVKYGLYSYAYITHEDAKFWNVA